MEIALSTEQIEALAPNASSIKAAKKLAQAKNWQQAGQNAVALWGNCQGSSLYQIRIEISTSTIQCTCPSHKQPCKHGLALLYLALNEPDAVPEIEAPEWIESWLVKRAAVTKRKETMRARQETGAEPNSEQHKAAEKRLTLVKQGIEQLELWLSDLIRNGLANVGQQGTNFWQAQVEQMVNAQAPGLAARLRRIAKIPNASADWPERLLDQLGELTLLLQAFHHIEQLEPGLQEEVRQMLGWTLNETEVLQRGEQLTDTWLFLGELVEQLEHGSTQQIWLVGRTTKRCAMISQFAAYRQGFPRTYPVRSECSTTLAYWPGIAPQRALVASKEELPSGAKAQAITSQLPGEPDIPTFLASVSQVLALQPWRNRFLCVLNDVQLCHQQDTWWIRDQQGKALPLAKKNDGYWPQLALSTGRAIDIAALWNGETLTPLGMLAQQTYYLFP